MHQVRSGTEADGKARPARKAVREVPSKDLRLRGLPALRQTAARETLHPEALLRQTLREHGVGNGESRRA